MPPDTPRLRPAIVLRQQSREQLFAEFCAILRHDEGKWRDLVGCLVAAGFDPRCWRITAQAPEEWEFAETCAARGARAFFWDGVEDGVPPLSVEADGTVIGNGERDPGSLQSDLKARTEREQIKQEGLRVLKAIQDSEDPSMAPSAALPNLAGLLSPATPSRDAANPSTAAAASSGHRATVAGRLVRTLGYAWTAAVMTLIAAGLCAIWWHEGWETLRTTMSPVNVWQWLATAVLLAPAFLALRAADWIDARERARREQKQQQRFPIRRPRLP